MSVGGTRIKLSGMPTEYLVKPFEATVCISDNLRFILFADLLPVTAAALTVVYIVAALLTRFRSHPSFLESYVETIGLVLPSVSTFADVLLVLARRAVLL